MQGLAEKYDILTMVGDQAGTMSAAQALDAQALDEEQSRNAAIEHCNELFSGLTPEKRVEWSLQHLPDQHVLTSSFGAQAAVSLHLVTSQRPDIPVVFVDTGYLFPETYQFVDELTERLKLNLKVYRSEMSPAWQEARYGQRWTQGIEGIEFLRTAMGELCERRSSSSEKKVFTMQVGCNTANFKHSQHARWQNDNCYQSWQYPGFCFNPIFDRHPGTEFRSCRGSNNDHDGDN